MTNQPTRDRTTVVQPSTPKFIPDGVIAMEVKPEATTSSGLHVSDTPALGTGDNSSNAWADPSSSCHSCRRHGEEYRKAAKEAGRGIDQMTSSIGVPCEKQFEQGTSKQIHLESSSWEMCTVKTNNNVVVGYRRPALGAARRQNNHWVQEETGGERRAGTAVPHVTSKLATAIGQVAFAPQLPSSKAKYGDWYVNY